MEMKGIFVMNKLEVMIRTRKIFEKLRNCKVSSNENHQTFLLYKFLFRYQKTPHSSSLPISKSPRVITMGPKKVVFRYCEAFE